MNDTTQAPGPGHNLPEDERAFAGLTERTDQCVETANRWLNERPELKTEDEAEKAADFLRQLRKLFNKKDGALDTARKDFNKPHEDAVKENNDRFRPLTRKVEIAMAALKKLQTVWLTKKEQELEEERRKAEAEAEAKRKAAEDAEKAAAEEQGGDVIGRQFEAEEAQRQADEADKEAARAAKARPKTGSAFGAKGISLRKREMPVIIDVTKIPARALKKLCDKPYVRDALTRALREDIEFARTLDGVEVREQRTAA